MVSKLGIFNSPPPPSRYSFDVKIKVLSSHHEDNFFRLQINVWDPIHSSKFPRLDVLSAPIKVISKPLKPKRKSAPRQKRKADQMTVTSPSVAPQSIVSSGGGNDTLLLIARQQEETLRIVKQIANFQEGCRPFLVVETLT